MKIKKILLSIISLITVMIMFSDCSTALIKNIMNKKDSIVTTDELTVYDEYEYETEHKEGTATNSKLSHTQNYITSNEAFIAKMKTLIDTSLYSESISSSGIISYTMNFEHKKETAYDFDYSIKLEDGTEFTLPAYAEELEQHGWSLDRNPQVDPNRVLSGPRFVNAQGKEIYWVSAKNNSDNTLNFNECEIVGYKLTQYPNDLTPETDNVIRFTVCDTLTEKSTLEDIIEKLGNPTEIVCNVVDYNKEYQRTEITLTYQQLGSPRNFLEFELSGDGNYITEIEYSKIN